MNMFKKHPKTEPRAGINMAEAFRHWKQETPVQFVDPRSLKPWADNPRDNDGVPVKQVMLMIQEFGWVSPIVAQRDTRQIIIGHTRQKAAIELGLDVVPVLFVDIAGNQAMALAIGDNRTSEFAQWEHEMLRLELSELNSAGMDIGIIGFDLEELESLNETADDIDDSECDGDDTKTYVVRVRVSTMSEAQDIVTEMSARGLEAEVDGE